MLKTTDTHAFFYSEWPSNFFRAPFRMDDHEFFCTEQAFMWLKAMHFNDTKTAELILGVFTPMAAKELGRSVEGYDDEEWDKVRYDMMYRVNLLKYRQNRDLCNMLLDKAYDGKMFVELSPTDGIWGIRTEAMNATEGYDDESKWAGRNLLGKAITAVRDTLVNEGYKPYGK